MAAVPVRKSGWYNIDGKLYPSVTTILGVINKPALMTWAAKKAAEFALSDPLIYDTPEKCAGAIYEKKESAAERGSDAHMVAESYALQPDATEAVYGKHPFFPAIKAFFQQMKPEVMYAEVVLVNRAMAYAGTCDLIARMADGTTYVIDYKTSKAVYPEYHLQVEAYRNSDLIILKDGMRIETTPMAEKTAVVLLRDDGTYQWSVVNGDLQAFLAAEILFHWQNKQKSRNGF